MITEYIINNFEKCFHVGKGNKKYLLNQTVQKKEPLSQYSTEDELIY